MARDGKKFRYIFGKRNSIEFLKTQNHNLVEKIFLKESLEKSTQSEILKVAKNCKIIRLDTKSLQQILPNQNHQGIAVVCKDSKNEKVGSWQDFRLFFKENPKGPFLVLDRIQDTGNLGNILRTAECFGITAIILSSNESAKISTQVEKMSSGAIHYLNIFQVPNLSLVTELLKENHIWIIASSDKGNQFLTSNLPPKEEIALIVGNEEKGVKHLLMKKADFILQIPMLGQINSLNVTVATGILLDRIINRKE